jgi:hypothetical protein
MSKVRLYGSTSGYIELAAPAVAPDSTLTLPALAGGFGKVAQIVQTVKADAFSTATTGSYVTVTGLSVSITPSSASSKILVVSNVAVGNSGANSVGIELRRDSTTIGSGTGGATLNGFGYAAFPSSNQMYKQGIMFLDSPATASAVTYEIRVYGAAGTTYVNRRGTDTFAGTSSDITVIEIAA